MPKPPKRFPFSVDFASKALTPILFLIQLRVLCYPKVAMLQVQVLKVHLMNHLPTSRWAMIDVRLSGC